MALIGAGAALLGTTVNAVQTADAAGEAKKQFDVQQSKEQDLINQAKAKDKEMQEVGAKIKKRDFQEQEQVSKEFDSNKTIFSGSLGVPTAPGGTKSLLGS